jgi:hypothetical protein
MIGNYQASKSFVIRERKGRSLWPVINIACKPISPIGPVSSVQGTEQSNICLANVVVQNYVELNPSV